MAQGALPRRHRHVPLSMQVKLLRAIQNRTVERVAALSRSA
jgi:DNA-binding NtrC family response regulator